MLRMVGADWNTAREQLPRLVQLGLVKVHEDGWEVVFSDDLTQENIPDRPLSRKKRTKAQNDVNPKVKKDLEISNETQGLTGRISSLSERAPEIIEEHRQSPRTQSSNEAEEEDLF